MSQASDTLFAQRLDEVYKSRDRVFAWLMAAQWVFAVGIAFVISPSGWAGKVETTHVHVYFAVFGGAALSIPTIALTLAHPGWVGTRHTVAIAQMLWSALLIHLTGGRIETHFHIFGSLAFLAFYRDWRVLVTATLVVSGEHLVRGLVWPESVYGIANPEWWRFLEHAVWVVFEDIVLVMGIAQNLKEMRTLAAQQTELQGVNATIEAKVVDRTRELEQSREQYRSLLETTRTLPWSMDVETMSFSYVGPQAQTLLGIKAESWLARGFLLDRTHPDDREHTRSVLQDAARSGMHQDVELRLRHADGTWVWVRAIISVTGEGSTRALAGVLLDVTERRRLERELQQAQKLESVGRLAAGIAHEINTPVQFVGDNLAFLGESVTSLLALAEAYQPLKATATPDALAAVLHAEEAADLEYSRDELPSAVKHSVDGLGRVATIVRSMRNFAHPEQKEMSAADLNRALETTLIIASNEYKYVADVITELKPLPPVTCHVSELNQVFLNLIVNAAHAIEGVTAKKGGRGTIKVSTRVEDGQAVVVSIADSGGGIPDAVRDRIFDPFFTTKPVGKGTGQGLAIARSVVHKHGGSIRFDSEPGIGTTFTIRLPIAGSPREVTASA